jgi:hypothetical protein
MMKTNKRPKDERRVGEDANRLKNDLQTIPPSLSFTCPPKKRTEKLDNEKRSVDNKTTSKHE